MGAEVHQHFDPDDNLTGYTVVSRESAWDEDTRGRALRLQEYEDGICGCGCMQPVAVAYDDTRVFRVDKFTCYAGRALEKVRETDRKAAEKDKRGGIDHGVHYYVVPHDTDD